MVKNLAALRLGDAEPRECKFIRMATKEHKVHKTGTVGHNHESHETPATTDDSNTETPHFALCTLHFALCTALWHANNSAPSATGAPIRRWNSRT